MAEQLLKSKNVLLTGASRGIGSAIAELYAKHGEDDISKYCGSCTTSYLSSLETQLSCPLSRQMPAHVLSAIGCSVMQVLACT